MKYTPVADLMERRRKEKERRELFGPAKLPSHLSGKVGSGYTEQAQRRRDISLFRKRDAERRTGLQQQLLGSQEGRKTELGKTAMQQAGRLAETKMRGKQQLGADQFKAEEAAKQREFGLSEIGKRGEEQRKTLGVQQGFAREEAERAGGEKMMGLGLKAMLGGLSGPGVDTMLGAGERPLRAVDFQRPLAPPKAPEQTFVQPKFNKKGEQLPGTGIWTTPPVAGQGVSDDDRTTIDAVLGGESFNPEKPTTQQRNYLNLLERTGRGDIVDDFMKRYGYGA